jgi:m7GpppX diphosphatase
MQLELDPPTNSGGIMERMTFTYGLGEQHGLFEEMRAVQAALDDK